MSENVCVSIIIPAYQAEKYLADCVTGVLSQSFTNFEAILIDDGSTDETPLLCDSYVREDPRIRVIHQENGGLSAARNAGLSIASGEYILFLDADDFWDDQDALANLAERIGQTHADVLNFSYKKYYEDTGEKVPYFEQLPAMPEALSGKKEQAEYLTENGLYIASACNKLIRRELLSTPEMRFEQGVFSEDIVWCLKLFLTAESLDFICENFYCYRQRKGSITHTIDDKKCRDLCDNILKCAALLDKADKDVKTSAERYTAYQLGTFFKNQALTEEKQRECIRELKDLKGLLKNHGSSRKLKLLDLSCRLIGFNGTCSLVRLAYLSRRMRSAK